MDEADAQIDELYNHIFTVIFKTVVETILQIYHAYKMNGIVNELFGKLILSKTFA